MPEDQSDRLMLELYDQLRETYRPSDGNELSLVDQMAFDAIRIRRRRHSEPDFPRFRLKIWRGAAGVNLVLRQEGEGAGPILRFRVLPNSPDIVEAVVSRVNELIIEESRRLIEYRKGR